MQYSKDEVKEAYETLRELLPPGSTVYTKLNHVSRSGMSRSITPLVIVDNEPRYLTWSVCVLFGQSRDRYDGVRMDGCGMDMGFDLVYRLSRCLYPDGFGIQSIGGEKNLAIAGYRPKTREEAARLVGEGYKFRGRNGDASGWDSNGGYALKQRWL